MLNRDCHMIDIHKLRKKIKKKKAVKGTNKNTLGTNVL